MRVGLFVTCLADLMRPSVAFAAVKLLEDAGCTVEVPAAQTCCGQPALNSGDSVDARDIARQRDRGLRRLRRRGRPLRFVHGHAAPGLPGPLRRRAGLARARRSTLAAQPRTAQLPGRCAEGRARRGPLRRPGHLPRQLRRPARDGRQGPAAQAAGQRGRGSTWWRCAAPKNAAASAAPSASSTPRSRPRWWTTRSPTSRPAAPAPCSAATWAACSTSPGASSAAGCRSACCTPPKCWPAWAASPSIGEPEKR